MDRWPAMARPPCPAPRTANLGLLSNLDRSLRFEEQLICLLKTAPATTLPHISREWPCPEDRFLRSEPHFDCGSIAGTGLCRLVGFVRHILPFCLIKILKYL